MKLNLKSVDLNLLTVFEAIMESRQLKRASEQLGMSQPAVSAALHRLRLTFKDDLFIRTRRGMQPTPRARAIYPRLRDALDMIRAEVQGSKHFDPAHCDRHFRIQGGDYLEILFYSALMRRITAVAPGVSSETQPLMLEGLLCAALKRGDTDMAVHYSRPDDRELHCEHLFDDRLVVVARRDHPRVGKRIGRTRFFHELHVALLPDESSAGHLERFLNQAALGRDIKARVSQFSSMIPVLLATDFLGVMPEKLADWFSERFPVTHCALPLDAPSLPVNLIWAHRFHDDLAHAWVREHLIGMMRETESPAPGQTSA
ncbi:LysR substrate-binding domain-containing protein [Parahaliea mediterranea]|uniref:LysR family transcriptional regulator n=1 Tax=Parahaliea mediterranea TaxID=651086 RepID=A0A939DEM5_9GAMM|nr:LysR substrate-binding domain-containing protein [Parahaliea mediterranea]MBN7796117.1 LysR family transcriptional regulator [Parahaliea mediterranea]